LRHFRRFKIAVNLVSLVVSEKVPLAARKWILRAFNQEFAEMRYLLGVADRPEGVKVKSK